MTRQRINRRIGSDEIQAGRSAPIRVNQPPSENPRTSRAGQLATALSEIAPSLQQFSDVKFAKDAELASAEAGQLARQAVEEGLSHAEAVRRGEAQAHKNPFFMASLREQLGGNAASQYDAHLRTRMTEDLDGMLDEDAFDDWERGLRQAWLEDHLEGAERDLFFEGGFGRATDSAVNRHRLAWADEVAARSLRVKQENHSSLVAATLRELPLGEAVAEIQRILDDQVALGLDPSVYNALTAEAIINAAEAAGDAGYLDAIAEIQAGDHKLIDRPRVLAAVTKSRESIASGEDRAAARALRAFEEEADTAQSEIFFRWAEADNLSDVDIRAEISSLSRFGAVGVRRAEALMIAHQRLEQADIPRLSDDRRTEWISDILFGKTTIDDLVSAAAAGEMSSSDLKELAAMLQVSLERAARVGKDILALARESDAFKDQITDLPQRFASQLGDVFGSDAALLNQARNEFRRRWVQWFSGPGHEFDFNIQSIYAEGLMQDVLDGVDPASTQNLGGVQRPPPTAFMAGPHRRVDPATGAVEDNFGDRQWMPREALIEVRSRPWSAASGDAIRRFRDWGMEIEDILDLFDAQAEFHGLGPIEVQPSPGILEFEVPPDEPIEEPTIEDIIESMRILPDALPRR